MHLWCTFYLSDPLFEARQLDALQSVINALLPDWSKSLRATADAGEKLVVVGCMGRLFDCVRAIDPARRGVGHVDLEGAERGLSFFLWHGNPTLPPNSNRLAIEIHDTSTVDGRNAEVWVHDAFSTLTRQLRTRYVKAHLMEEFDAKNMHHGDDGHGALGVHLSQYLPGLYWLNYFGRPYCDLMGRERILSSPAYEVSPSGDGVIVSLGESPEEWNTAPYQQREQAVLDHLGKPYFFSRSDPRRESLAPDFEAIHKAENP